MQDQVVVCMRHGGNNIQEQAQPRLDVQGTYIAPAVDRFAVDVFEHQVGLPGHHACVEQARDVRVRQPRKQTAFAPEALGAAAR